MDDEMRILSVRPCGTSRILLHAVKSYDVGPSRFTSHPIGRCAADFYRPYKSPSPWPGSNPQSLGPLASTLTTTPPRRPLSRHTLCEALDCMNLVLVKRMLFPVTRTVQLGD
jgi:hypothetical protein